MERGNLTERAQREGMKIVFVCHFFHPEIGAPSARVLEMAREWTKSGHSVKVITGFPNHPTGVISAEYRWKLFGKEIIEDIEVFRSYVYARPNSGIFGRTFNHLSFTASSLLMTLPRVGHADIVVVSSPTLFSVISAYIISLVKGVPYVFEVRDLWPAIFAQLGVVRNRHILRALERLELFLYSRAKKIVTVTEGFRTVLAQRGVPAGKIDVITNGADVDFFTCSESMRVQFIEENDLWSKFVVLYLGAHGISHGLDTVIECAALMRGDDVHFLFVGEGTEKESTQAYAEKLELENVTFLSGQSRENVPQIYAASSLCLVPLRNVDLFDTFIPSKMFEIMAAGRPIVGAVRGEAAEILRRAGCALVVAPEDAVEMSAAVRRLRGDADLRRRLGEVGRRFVEREYDRSKLAHGYLNLLKSMTGDEGGSGR